MDAGLVALRRRAWGRLAAAQPPAWVPGHCRAVEGLAAAMCDAAEAEGLEPDRAVALPGALLHDVGRAQAQDVRHASLGAALLRADQPPWDAHLVRAVERHTGAGIDRAEAEALGLPPKDYTPKSLEERIVAHADNLFSGERRLTMDQFFLFLILEVTLILAFGVVAFHVPVRGSLALVGLTTVLGSLCFAGIGLLVAARARTLEAASGLMNLVMVPMWLLSGVFFSSERFPKAAQPVIQALPLTALNNALRAVMLEGKTLPAVSGELLIVTVWGILAFAAALKIFRWQ